MGSGFKSFNSSLSDTKKHCLLLPVTNRSNSCVCAQIIVAVAINKERPHLPHDAPPRLASLILRCWAENPAARPRIDAVLVELYDMMQVRSLAMCC